MPARNRKGRCDLAAANWARSECSASLRATAGAHRVVNQAPNMPRASRKATAIPMVR